MRKVRELVRGCEKATVSIYFPAEELELKTETVGRGK